MLFMLTQQVINNVAVGTNALICNIGGNHNIAIGKSALGSSAVTASSSSVMIGYQAGCGMQMVLKMLVLVLKH